MNAPKISLQQYVDKVVADEFRQTLKTPDEVVAVLGWGSVESPTCCGTDVTTLAFISSLYFAECKACGKWASAADAPNFVSNSAQFVDHEKVNLETEARWLVGSSAPSIPGAAK